MRTYSVYSNSWLTSLENWRTVTDILALLGSITICRSSKINIWVGISSYKVKCVKKKAAHTEARINAGFTSSILRRLNYYIFTFKRSKISSGIDKKQFKNAPNITLPKFFESNLPRGFPQLKLSSLKYQPTAFPDITKLTK